MGLMQGIVLTHHGCKNPVCNTHRNMGKHSLSTAKHGSLSHGLVPGLVGDTWQRPWISWSFSEEGGPAPQLTTRLAFRPPGRDLSARLLGRSPPQSCSRLRTRALLSRCSPRPQAFNGRPGVSAEAPRVSGTRVPDSLCPAQGRGRSSPDPSSLLSARRRPARAGLRAASPRLGRRRRTPRTRGVRRTLGPLSAAACSGRLPAPLRRRGPGRSVRDSAPAPCHAGRGVTWRDEPVAVAFTGHLRLSGATSLQCLPA